MNLLIFKPILEVLVLIVPVLFAVAFVTVAERKTMASMQRRLGPNSVGFFGMLQAFADALKLLLKEYISPSQANLVLFFLGPIFTLIFSLMAFSVIPYGPGITLFNHNLSILYLLAVSSLSTYGILVAGWSANSKYAFLGSLRSTAQLISYELIITSAILLVIFFTGNLNLNITVETQYSIWYILPLLPIFIIFFIGSIAETNRAPFDLAEAESELVSGFMTEHSAVIFVFFFLAEYGSIVLMCILTSVLFLGGYLYYNLDFSIIWNIYSDELFFVNNILEKNLTILNRCLDFMIFGFSLGLKSCIMIFIFIWVRASYPRIRYDQLMLFCWTILLPLVVAFIGLVSCIIYSLDIVSVSLSLLCIPLRNVNKIIISKPNKFVSFCLQNFVFVRFDSTYIYKIIILLTFSIYIFVYTDLELLTGYFEGILYPTPFEDKLEKDSNVSDPVSTSDESKNKGKGREDSSNIPGTDSNPVPSDIVLPGLDYKEIEKAEKTMATTSDPKVAQALYNDINFDINSAHLDASRSITYARISDENIAHRTYDYGSKDNANYNKEISEIREKYNNLVSEYQLHTKELKDRVNDIADNSPHPIEKEKSGYDSEPESDSDSESKNDSLKKDEQNKTSSENRSDYQDSSDVVETDCSSWTPFDE